MNVDKSRRWWSVNSETDAALTIPVSTSFPPVHWSVQLHLSLPEFVSFKSRFGEEVLVLTETCVQNISFRREAGLGLNWLCPCSAPLLTVFSGIGLFPEFTKALFTPRQDAFQSSLYQQPLICSVCFHFWRVQSTVESSLSYRNMWRLNCRIQAVFKMKCEVKLKWAWSAIAVSLVVSQFPIDGWMFQTLALRSTNNTTRFL